MKTRRRPCGSRYTAFVPEMFVANLDLQYALELEALKEMVITLGPALERYVQYTAVQYNTPQIPAGEHEPRKLGFEAYCDPSRPLPLALCTVVRKLNEPNFTPVLVARHLPGICCLSFKVLL